MKSPLCAKPEYIFIIKLNLQFFIWFSNILKTSSLILLQTITYVLVLASLSIWRFLNLHYYQLSCVTFRNRNTHKCNSWLLVKELDPWYYSTITLSLAQRWSMYLWKYFQLKYQLYVFILYELYGTIYTVLHIVYKKWRDETNNPEGVELNSLIRMIVKWWNLEGFLNYQKRYW